MTFPHKNFTDPEIHEPKDVSTASSGEVYVADGLGSGTWKPTIPHGWGLYDDSAGTQTLGTTAAKITIDGLGAKTEEDYLPATIRGLDTLWDSANNEITPVLEGDTYACHLEFNVTTMSTAAYLRLELDDGGLASPTSIITAPSIPIFATGKYSITFNFHVTADMITNGGQVFLTSDAGSPVIDSKTLFINRLSAGDL